MASVPAWCARVCRVAAGLTLMWMACLAKAQPPTEVADFAAAPGNGTYVFASATPRTLTALFNTTAAGDGTRIIGHLYLPPLLAGSAPVPAVVFMHGSGGLFDAMLGYWPKRFNAAGYAMLALDTFSPRGVRSTAEDQTLVPFAADIADVYAALRLMAAHPRIDPDRIALMGTSRGGTAAWRAALQRVAQSPGLAGGQHYAAFIPLYSGGCVGGTRAVVAPGVFVSRPMLWVHGDADDYAPMAPCREYAEHVDAAGTPTTFVALPGARHKFDADDPRRHWLRGVEAVKATCPLELDMQTLTYRDRFTGQPMSIEQMREVHRSACARLGATVEGDRVARDQAAQAVLGFLQTTFGR